MPDADLVAAIETALAERGSLRMGAELRFRCAMPDHADRHPSARWRAERAVWWCDVCGVGGGAVALARLLGVAFGRRRTSTTVRKELAQRHAERLERETRSHDARARWLAALHELREAQADVYLI